MRCSPSAMISAPRMNEGYIWTNVLAKGPEEMQ